MVNSISSTDNMTFRPGICDNDVNSMYPLRMKASDPEPLFYRVADEHNRFKWKCTVRYKIKNAHKMANLIREHIPNAECDVDPFGPNGNAILNVIFDNEVDDAHFGFLTKTIFNGDEWSF